MIKRIEFTLNLDDPYEAAIYQALRPSLKYRRAGALIRAALDAHLVKPKNDPRQPYGQHQLGGGQ